MSTLEITRSPELIAAEINHIKNETRITLINNSIEIGRRLIEAKSIVGHGEWGNWLKEKVDYSQRTANNLMRIFDEYGADQISLFGDTNSQAFANLSYTQAVALLSIPDPEERENFVIGNDVENMSTRELQQAIKDKEKAEKEKEEAIKSGEKLKEQAKNIEIQKAKLEADLRIKDQSLEMNKESIDKLYDELGRNREASNLQINNLNANIAKIKKELEDAKDTGDNEEVDKLQRELDKKQNEIAEYAEKVKELEEQLKEKPVEVTVVEKVPKEIEAELEQLRNKACEGEVVTKYKIAFKSLVKDFNELLEAIDGMDGDIKIKYSGATKNLIEKMMCKL